jgi:hypothetical protein
VVVYDTAGEFRECDNVGGSLSTPSTSRLHASWKFSRRPSPRRTANIRICSLPAMSELLLRAIESGHKTLSDIRANVLKIAEPHEVDTAYALRRRLAHLDGPQFKATDVPIQPGNPHASTSQQLDRVGRIAYVLAHLELTRNGQKHHLRHRRGPQIPSLHQPLRSLQTTSARAEPLGASSC